MKRKKWKQVQIRLQLLVLIKMKDSEKLSKLIEKLDNYIHHLDGVKPSNTSPTHEVNVRFDSTPTAHLSHLSDDMCLEKLTKDELTLLHSRLHMHYPRGTKTLSKQGIEKLHEEVKVRLKHFNFDQLDKEHDKR